MFPKERPNILFAIADDWFSSRWAYGCQWAPTPAFTPRDGILFNRAYTPNAKCAPPEPSFLLDAILATEQVANHMNVFRQVWRV